MEALRRAAEASAGSQEWHRPECPGNMEEYVRISSVQAEETADGP